MNHHEKNQPANGSGGRADFVPLSALSPEAGRQRYWRSLDELAGSESYRREVDREFHLHAPREMQGLHRRDFLRLMGAGLALAGVAGCASQPAEKIVPYIDQPESLIPGKPLFFTTAFQRGGYAIGLLGESHMGRPIKVEGNPKHPASLGATDAVAQASVLGLYDPERSQAVRYLGDLTTWDAFIGAQADPMRAQRAAAGAGIRIITGTVTSPTLTAQLRRFLARYPQAKIHVHEPVSRDAVREGARLAFGQEVQPVYQLDAAAVVLSLDADFFQDEPGSVRYARDTVDRRLVRDGKSEMNRLYVVESSPTITGAYADHRQPVRPSQIEAVARAVAAGVGVPGAAGAAVEGLNEWVAGAVKDLQAHRGSSLVIAGQHQPAAVHVLAHAINGALGNIGKTVTFTAPVESRFGAQETSLKAIAADAEAGRVQLLLILGSNPVYSGPADVDFLKALRTLSSKTTALTIHLGLYDDETGIECRWHLPESHYLEAWGDARAYDGTACIVQPLIVPLYASRSAVELVGILLDGEDRSGYHIVRDYWSAQVPGGRAPVAPAPVPGAGGGERGAPLPPAPGAGGRVPGGAAQRAPGAAPGLTGGGSPYSPAFEKFWTLALNTGVVPNSRPPAKAVAARAGGVPPAAAAAPAPAASGNTLDNAEVVLRPDPTVWDGSFANNAALQELPKPLTTLTWDNAALISPGTAQQLGLIENVRDFDAMLRVNGEWVTLEAGGRSLKVPVWITPGQPDGAVTLTLGYGRSRAGSNGTGKGFNAYALRTAASPWLLAGVKVTVTPGELYKLANAQRHFHEEARNLVREGALEELHAHPTAPAFMARGRPEPGAPPSLMPQVWPSDRREAGEGDSIDQKPGVWEGEGYHRERPIPAWGMVIDLNACIGCNACTVACQVENNIPVVGKDQVLIHRQMHWIRVDNYYSGDPVNPEVIFEPLPCMHCEKAPCEPVCPVEATTHSAEGINEMTYNRCIGTRYCQNNCPYKVRRFNFLQFSDQQTPTIQMMQNPDVTVRSRGVMEKCTYCIQRINEARIEAEKEERVIRDGEILTACQQVCPTRAIVFGDVNDVPGAGSPGSKVRTLKESPLNFSLLPELNTLPRTSYLAKLRNPNPAVREERGSVRDASSSPGGPLMPPEEHGPGAPHAAPGAATPGAPAGEGH